MDLKRPLVLLALVGSLTACGDNTNLGRGNGECSSAEDSGDCIDVEDGPGMQDGTDVGDDRLGEAGTGAEDGTTGEDG